MRKEISFLLRQEGKKLREVIELAQYRVAVKCLGLTVWRVGCRGAGARPKRTALDFQPLTFLLPVKAVIPGRHKPLSSYQLSVNEFHILS